MAIVLLAVLLFLRTRSPLVLAGLGLLYYWTLYGAWFIVMEQTGTESPMHYHTIFRRLTPVYLDSGYLQALLYYLGFMLVLELVLLAGLRRPGGDAPPPQPVELSQGRLLAVSLVSGVAAIAMLGPVLAPALSAGQPLYALINRQLAAGKLPLYSLHQLLVHLSLLPAAVGVILALCGPQARYLRAPLWRPALAGQLLVLAAMFVFMGLTGNRHELFVTMVTALLLYLVNHPRPRFWPVAGAGVGTALFMGVIDLARGLGFKELTTSMGGGLGAWAKQVFTSNEAFAAHVSMYYSLQGDLPLTWGSSLISLAASVIPKALWAGRPPDIYHYYAQGLGVEGLTGYTIHHATGWYLNFGFMGVLAGAVVLGWIWSGLLAAPGWAIAGRGPRWRALAALVPCTFTAHLVSVVRAGPECYKGVALTAVAVPLVMLLLSVLPTGPGADTQAPPQVKP